MSDEIEGPAPGTSVSFYRDGSSEPESAVVAELFSNGDVPMAKLNFDDGTVLTVAVSEIAS